MSLSDIFSLANIAGALVAIVVLLAFGVHYLSRLDPGTRDKLGAGHGKRDDRRHP